MHYHMTKHYCHMAVSMLIHRAAAAMPPACVQASVSTVGTSSSAVIYHRWKAKTSTMITTEQDHWKDRHQCTCISGQLSGDGYRPPHQRLQIMRSRACKVITASNCQHQESRQQKRFWPHKHALQNRTKALQIPNKPCRTCFSVEFDYQQCQVLKSVTDAFGCARGAA